MDRRDMIKTGLLAGLAALLPKGAFAAASPLVESVENQKGWKCKTMQVLAQPGDELIFRRPYVAPGGKEITLIGHPHGIPDEIWDGEGVILPDWTFNVTGPLSDKQLSQMICGIVTTADRMYKEPCFHYISRIGKQGTIAFFAGSKPYEFCPKGLDKPGQKPDDQKFTVYRKCKGSIKGEAYQTIQVYAYDLQPGDKILKSPYE